MSLNALNHNPVDRRPTKGWKVLISCGDGTWITSKIRYPLVPGWNEDIVTMIPPEFQFPLYTLAGKPYPRGFHICLQEPQSKTDLLKAEIAVEVEIDPDTITAFGYVSERDNNDLLDAVVARRIKLPPRKETVSYRTDQLHGG